jgi:hypothetical protein
MNTSVASEANRSRVGLRVGLRKGLAGAGELDGSGTLCGSTGARPRLGVPGLGSTSMLDWSGKYCPPGEGSADVSSGTPGIGGLESGVVVIVISAGDEGSATKCGGCRSGLFSSTGVDATDMVSA